MLIYIIVYFFVFVSIFFDRKSVSLRKKKVVVGLNIIILSLFFGLRWECGTDWQQYYDCFKYARWNNIFSYYRYGDQYMEPGFMFVNVFLKTICNSYTFYLLITNFVRFLIHAYISFKLSKYPILTFVFLLTIQFLFPTRNPFAVSILLIAHYYIIQRKIVPYLLTILLACSIHISSIIFLPVYFLYNVRLNFFIQLSIYSLSIILASTIPAIVGDIGVYFAFMGDDFYQKTVTYTSLDRDVGLTRAIYSYILPLFFLSLYNYVKQKEPDPLVKKKMNYYLNNYVLSVSLLNIFVVSLSDLTRFAQMLDMSPFLIPFVVQYFKRYQFLIYIILVLYFFYRWHVSIVGAVYKDALIPYKSILG
jgi:hypothetical protein